MKESLAAEGFRRGTAPAPPRNEARQTALLAVVDFGSGGNSAACILDGWGEQEGGHRWSVGQESAVRLPVPSLGSDCVVVIDVIPWCTRDCLPTQTVMLAIDGRLLATLQVSDHRVLAFAIPPGTRTAPQPVLTLSHLHCGVRRPPAGLDRNGSPLGVMVTSIRVFRLPLSEPSVSLPALPGVIADGVLPRAATALTGLSPSQLALRAESIGHNCEFGLVQRDLNAEPLGLLRFASLVTHKLVDGLMACFEGVGAPGATRIFVSDPPKPEFKVHEELYYLWYSVGRTPEETTQAAVHREQCRRLAFLQRKFLEDLRAGEKLFVMTRPELLTEAEALAVFCALQVQGPNTLLWTLHGDAARAGQVDRDRPGMLRGHLGVVDDRCYGTTDAWLSVLANACALQSPNFGDPTARERGS